jgi:hypothetical protein
MSFHDNSESLSSLPFLLAETESVEIDIDSESTPDFEVLNSAAGIDSTQTLSHQYRHLLPREAVSFEASEGTTSQSTKKPRFVLLV